MTVSIFLMFLVVVVTNVVTALFLSAEITKLAKRQPEDLKNKEKAVNELIADLMMVLMLLSSDERPDSPVPPPKNNIYPFKK